MKRHVRRGPSGWFAVLLAAACVLPVWLGGCLGTGAAFPEEAVFIEDPPADSVVFWPPTMRYARFGDTLYLVVHGLKRQKVCAAPDIGWRFQRDSTGTESYRVRSSFEIPEGASCAGDPTGLDTLFRVQFFTRVGNTLYLKTPDGTATDSLDFIASDARNLVTVLNFKHAPGADSTVHGPAVYHDSTATHPRRMVRIDSLPTCEILQTAVYEKQGDTTRVKVRLIKATPQPAATFPPCAGPHADSVEVVFNRHNFLP